MPEDETPAPQTAPTPTTLSVPPGIWQLKVAKGNGQPIAIADIEGPLTLTVGLVPHE